MEIKRNSILWMLRLMKVLTFLKLKMVILRNNEVLYFIV